jgi:hypothetical protein
MRKIILILIIVLFVPFLGSLMTENLAGAADWYVRPYGGSYGSADGTTYNTAWGGLDAVQWGSGKVAAGDTLWVCGTHDGSYPHGMMTVGASGTPGSHITIRGDCTTISPGYANGIIWNVHDKYPKGYIWKGPDAYGAYYTSQVGDSNGPPAIEDQTAVLVNSGKVPDATWEPGTFYDDTKNLIIYYKPTSGAATTHLLYTSNPSPSFTIVGHNYIDVKNLTWEMAGENAIKIASANYVTMDNLDIIYAIIGIEVDNNGTSQLSSNNCSVTNSTIHEAGNGIYFITSNGVTSPSTYWTITGNTIYNINRSDIVSTDRHAIGIQGASNFTVSRNVIHNIGLAGSPTNTAINFFAWPGLYVDNNIVTRNYIYNAIYGGIAMNTDSSNSCDPETLKNNIVSYNIVSSCGSTGNGITWKSSKATDGSPSAKVINNTVNNCANSYEVVEYSNNDSNNYTSFSFLNNISLFPITRHFNYITGATNKNWSSVTMNNNIYYPDGALFKWNFTDSQTFTQFKKLLMNVIGADSNSLTYNPLLTNFIPSYNSPAITAGANLCSILTSSTDYLGNVVCAGGIYVRATSEPAIGACE